MENYLKLLNLIGLTDYEAKTYLSLLRLGSVTVKDIQSQCQVPKNKIYESLNQMIRKGIIENVPTIPKRYKINNISSLYTLLEEREQQLKEIRSNVKELEKLKTTTLQSNTELVWIVYGDMAFKNKLKEATIKLKQECLMVVNQLKYDPVLLRLTKEAIKSKGIKVKVLYNSGTIQNIHRWKTIGCTIKKLENAEDMTFSVFDNFLCRLTIQRSNPHNPTLWIESPIFIQTLKERFEMLWKKSANLKS